MRVDSRLSPPPLASLLSGGYGARREDGVGGWSPLVYSSCRILFLLVVALPYVEKWSRSPDPFGWIRRALDKLRLLATLRRARQVAEFGRGISVIKAARICSQMRPSRVCGTAVLAFLLAVLRWAEPYAEDSGAASFFPHKLEERLSVLEVVVLLCWVELELASSYSRRRGDRRDRAAAPFPLLDADAHPELVCVKMHASGAMLNHGNPKPRPSSTEAIHGERRRSVLWSFYQRYFFLLCWRIFDLGKGNSGAVVPSGLFPGDNGDALALRFMAVGGEDKGSNCVLCFQLEVLFVSLEDATVIFLFFGFLLVTLYKPR